MAKNGWRKPTKKKTDQINAYMQILYKESISDWLMLLRVPALLNLFVYLLFISLSVSVFKAKVMNKINK